jgi:putative intracellular protease/amidase
LRFVDFLRSTVMLSAGAATTLGVITVLAAGQSSDDVLVFVCAGWWLAAAATGTLLGRRATATPPIARVLADAKNATMLPEHRPGSILLNRLWPLLVSMVVAGGLAVVVPQVTGIATGFAIIWALAWRRQDGAVAAIEERDGVTFYVEQTSPVRPIQLLRTPGFRREVPSLNGSR